MMKKIGKICILCYDYIKVTIYRNDAKIAKKSAAFGHFGL